MSSSLIIRTKWNIIKQFKSKHQENTQEYKKDFEKFILKMFPRAKEKWNKKEDKILLSLVKKYGIKSNKRLSNLKIAFNEAAKKLGRTYSACEGRYRMLKFCECQK